MIPGLTGDTLEADLLGGHGHLFLLDVVAQVEIESKT
jgi:hypothetical protein